MANPYEIPDKINNFNVYDGKSKLIGISSFLFFIVILVAVLTCCRS